ncbi:MAG: tetratricopeptide repeat protein [Halioglobus sp.]
MTIAPNSNVLARLALVTACALGTACATEPAPSNPGAKQMRESAMRDKSATRDRSEAIAAYRDHLSRYPGSADYDAISRRLADLLLAEAAQLQLDGANKAGNTAAIEAYSEAIAHYEYLLDKNPPAPEKTELLYQLSRAQQESGSSQEALASIALLLQQEPDDSVELRGDTLFRRGEMMFSTGNYLEAARSYQLVVDMGPRTPPYQQSLYKLGWSLFKQENYRASLDPAFLFLDLKLPASKPYAQPAGILPGADGEQVADMFRVISMSFSQLGGLSAAERYLASNKQHSYQRQIYRELAGLYEKREQTGETAEVLMTLARSEPLNAEAPRLTARVISLYGKAGFQNRSTAMKIELVQTYGRESDFWTQHSPENFPDIVALVRTSLRQLADLFHTETLRTGAPGSADQAEHWYREYLAANENAADTSQMRLKLAELLYEIKRYPDALKEYDLAANSGDLDLQTTEAAALGAIYASEQILKSSDPALEAALAHSATSRQIKFVESYPRNPIAPQLLVNAGTALLEQRQYLQALELGQHAAAGTTGVPQEMTRVGWTLVAQASYALEDYPTATEAYREALLHQAANNTSSQALRKGLAMATYQQAGQSLAQGDTAQAAALYQQVIEIAPDAAIRSSASYDAATTLLILGEWMPAIGTLKQYRADHPQDELQTEVTKKLAYAYQQNGDWAKAAVEYQRLGRKLQLPDSTRREALIRAATLSQDSGNTIAAISIGEYYVDNFPRPVDLAIKQMQQLANLESASGNERRRRHWLKAMIRLEPGAHNREISEIVAHAALELAEYHLQTFRMIQLVDPVQENLLRKIASMEQVLESLERAASYQIPPVSTAAIDHIASLYAGMSDALLNSERPAGLTKNELAEYDLLLAEQAGSFEQQAIDIYATNTQRLQQLNQLQRDQ